MSHPFLSDPWFAEVQQLDRGGRRSQVAGADEGGRGQRHDQAAEWRCPAVPEGWHRLLSRATATRPMRRSRSTNRSRGSCSSRRMPPPVFKNVHARRARDRRRPREGRGDADRRAEQRTETAREADRRDHGIATVSCCFGADAPAVARGYCPDARNRCLGGRQRSGGARPPRRCSRCTG